MKPEKTTAGRNEVPEDVLRKLQELRCHCFWWVPDNVSMSELSMDTIVRGLRLHGGRDGWKLAERLCR